MKRSIPTYIAFRYLISKKGSTAVTFITWLAAIAMMVAVAAMFIIISVFSGLEALNKQLISNLHADITIKSKNGKTLDEVLYLEKNLKDNSEIISFSKVIEEKIYIDFDGKGDIAYLRGVDPNYTLINPINKEIIFGSYPSFRYTNEVLMEVFLNNRLSIPIDSSSYSTIYMPKAGVGIINKEEDIFNKKEIYTSGVFPGKDQLNNYIIAPIELCQELLELPKDAAYQIVIKLKDPEKAEQFRDNLNEILRNKYQITTKKEENAAFWKMINIEKLFIFLIFALVILITTFNLAGAIIILQLDKKDQAKSLISIGLAMYDLRKVYFYTGLFIVFIGVILGLFIGTIISLIQIQTGVFMANPTLPFPVEIKWYNYLLVAITALGFGILVSWFSSIINKNHIQNF